MVHQTVHIFEQQPKCFWARSKKYDHQIFLVTKCGQQKLVTQNCWGMKKKSIDGSTSIIDWTIKIFQVA